MSEKKDLLCLSPGQSSEYVQRKQLQDLVSVPVHKWPSPAFPSLTSAVSFHTGCVCVCVRNRAPITIKLLENRLSRVEHAISSSPTACCCVPVNTPLQ